VFNKLLNNSIEKVMVDPTKLPGHNETFVLNDGIVDLHDSTGASVPSFKYWDPTGSPGLSSDALNLPFGPAIVIKPLDPMLSSENYTVVVHTGTIQDRGGNGMADQNGAALSGDFSVPFHTAIVAPNAATPTTPDFSKAVKVGTDSVFQFAFDTQVAVPAPSSIKLTVPAGATVNAFAYYDRYTDTDGTTCVVNKTTLNIVNVDNPASATPMPVAWPVGDYTITFVDPGIQGLKKTGKDVYAPDMPLKFTIDAAAKTGMDSPYTVLLHPINMCPPSM
jgi:hypothetical protein